MTSDEIEFLRSLGLDPAELELLTAHMRDLLISAGVDHKLLTDVELLTVRRNILEQATAQLLAPQDPALAKLSHDILRNRQ